MLKDHIQKGLLKHTTKTWNLPICHSQTSTWPQIPVQNAYGVLQKGKKSLHFYLLQHYPATRHYKHHAFPSQVLKNSLGHFDLSCFVILSFSLTSQVLQAASLDQVILWRLSPFVLYLPFTFSQVLRGNLSFNRV